MRKFKKSGRRVAVPFLPGSVETWCLCRIRCVALRLRPGPGPPFSRYAIANEQVIRNRNTLDGSRSESITSNGSEIALRQEPTGVESDIIGRRRPEQPGNRVAGYLPSGHSGFSKFLARGSEEESPEPPQALHGSMSKSGIRNIGRCPGIPDRIQVRIHDRQAQSL